MLSGNWKDLHDLFHFVPNTGNRLLPEFVFTWCVIREKSFSIGYFDSGAMFPRVNKGSSSFLR